MIFSRKAWLKVLSHSSRPAHRTQIKRLSNAKGIACSQNPRTTGTQTLTVPTSREHRTHKTSTTWMTLCKSKIRPCCSGTQQLHARRHHAESASKAQPRKVPSSHVTCKFNTGTPQGTDKGCQPKRQGAHGFKRDARAHGGLGEDHGHGEASKGLVAVVAALQGLFHLRTTAISKSFEFILKKFHSQP